MPVVKMSIALEPEQAQGLRILAAREGLTGQRVTVSGVIRRLVDKELKRKSERKPEAAA